MPSKSCNAQTTSQQAQQATAKSFDDAKILKTKTEFSDTLAAVCEGRQKKAHSVATVQVCVKPHLNIKVGGLQAIKF